MDFVIERIISAKLGPKWEQLYSRLDLRPRDRYRIATSHGNTHTEEERYACYVRDTINEWRSRVKVAGIDESEAIKHLLCALERVQGFEGVASDIASASGKLIS